MESTVTIGVLLTCETASCIDLTAFQVIECIMLYSNGAVVLSVTPVPQVWLCMLKCSTLSWLEICGFVGQQLKTADAGV